MIVPSLRLTLLLLACLAPVVQAAPAASTVAVGFAKIDITPELPIRLSGYQSRAAEATQAETRLFARAMAIGSTASTTAVLITVELIGIGEPTSAAVTAALKAKHGIERARIALAATHVHSGPALSDVLPFMFSRDLPAAENERITRYTEQLRTKLIQVAEAALADRRPGRLAWSEGRVDFAAQRRVVTDGKWKTFGVVPEGPVDHALPVLRAVDEQGAVRGVFLNYACHCTTVEGGNNFVHHDWAGDAAAKVEAANSGAVALVAIGCGADANPNPRGMPAIPGHGNRVATEIQRLLAAPMQSLGPVTRATFTQLDLGFAHAVTRAELEQRTGKDAKAVSSYAATQLLRRLNAGQPLPKTVPLPVQTWTFGDDLAMVFLGGEVVSEYSLRLKRELDGRRLWVNAYANSVPCYIPSRRMFDQGGYEVDGSMDYYGWPTRLASGTEDQIIAAVRAALPREFHPSQRP